MTGLDSVTAGLRFAAALPGFLRLRVDHPTALAEVQQRLRARPAAFLDLMRSAVYSDPRQPMRRLLALAGCEYGDLAALVRGKGLEGALATLCARGIYLTCDELAGRTPVRRGSTTFDVPLATLANPWSRRQVPASSGGSRRATPGELLLDLHGLGDLVPTRRLGYDAEGTAEAVQAVWAVPGSAVLVRMLVAAVAFGAPPAAWFTPVALGAIAPRYRLSETVLYWLGRTRGLRFPRPRHVGLDDPRPIAVWLHRVLRDGAMPHLACAPASAVRLCEAALAAGIDIAGARVVLRGEPVTAARIEALGRAGVRPSTLYGTVETGIVGHGCQRPSVPDEVHVFEDLHAIAQPAIGHPALPAGALLLTSLRRAARLILLNASVGDTGVLTRRACGCPLERYGFTTHLHGIRSFEKLTGAGMTFADAELAPILEHTLPQRFGGGPTDFQLEETESSDGRAQVRLIVHPRLGPLDETALLDAFLDALDRMSEARHVMSLTWRGAGLVSVARRPPAVTGAGKILHFVAAQIGRSVTADGNTP